MVELTLEIVEGPDAGRQLAVDGTVVIGRSPEADLVLADPQVSRLHARVTVDGGTAVVEDLGSANGTFINHAELHGPARLDPGDDLLVGVTVLALRTPAEIAAAPSAVRPVPPGLARPLRAPDYLPPAAPAAAEPPAPRREIARLYDVRVRKRANLAPLAVFVLVCFVVMIFLATR
ncbi:MAG TPA: FHA domain-containing protein [Solirubrobacteraceae bacterium]|nr:FHA domain-containing protein [Solirubrobacteraceae bacterium]